MTTHYCRCGDCANMANGICDECQKGNHTHPSHAYLNISLSTYAMGKKCSCQDCVCHEKVTDQRWQAGLFDCFACTEGKHTGALLMTDTITEKAVLKLVKSKNNETIKAKKSTIRGLESNESSYISQIGSLNQSLEQARKQRDEETILLNRLTQDKETLTKNAGRFVESVEKIKKLDSVKKVWLRSNKRGLPTALVLQTYPLKAEIVGLHFVPQTMGEYRIYLPLMATNKGVKCEGEHPNVKEYICFGEIDVYPYFKEFDVYSLATFSLMALSQVNLANSYSDLLSIRAPDIDPRIKIVSDLVCTSYGLNGDRDDFDSAGFAKVMYRGAFIYENGKKANNFNKFTERVWNGDEVDAYTGDKLPTDKQVESFTKFINTEEEKWEMT